MDLRQTKAYARYLKKIGWISKKDLKSGAVIYVRRLPLTGVAVMKIQRPVQLPAWNTIAKLIKKYRVIQVNVEPDGDNQIRQMVKWRMKRQKIPFLPSTTVLLDLKLPFKTLLALMKPKTRYNLGLAEKKEVRVETINGEQLLKNTKSFETLFNMQKRNAKRLGIFVLPKKWFRAQVEAMAENCFAVMAYFDNQLVAATFYMTSDDTVCYSHNGSMELGRKVFAPTACVAAGIKEGQKRKLKWLDFEGIYDPRSKVIRWQGFTRFKQGFGGRVVMLPGLYSKWVWPFGR